MFKENHPIMNEQPKTVEDIAEAFILDNMLHGKTAESVRTAFKHPAFIADIVRQTLEYVEGLTVYGDMIEGLTDEIVNNIIKKK
jgi:hypothetical protein